MSSGHRLEGSTMSRKHRRAPAVQGKTLKDQIAEIIVAFLVLGLLSGLAWSLYLFLRSAPFWKALTRG